jgi:Tfp pilus assembly protein PilE
MGKLLQNQKMNGFTIVELIVIIVVIGILASITIVSYGGITKSSKAKAVTADLQTTASNLSKYRAKNGSFPPSSSEFNASVDKANTSGVTTYTYTYDVSVDKYCLAASGNGVTYNITSSNSNIGDGATCSGISSLSITSPTNIDTAPNVFITISGTGTPGSYIVGSQCAGKVPGFTVGSRCYASSTVSRTIPASGNWTMNIYMVDFIGTGQTVLGTNPVATNANCTSPGQCEMQILDFGTNNSPTNINQALGSRTIPVYAQIN